MNLDKRIIQPHADFIDGLPEEQWQAYMRWAVPQLLPENQCFVIDRIKARSKTIDQFCDRISAAGLKISLWSEGRPQP